MDIYPILHNLNNLFKNNNYIIKVGSKLNPNDIKQNITYINKINITEKYIINIESENKIEVIIPLKHTNYSYKTNVNIDELYNYIKIHI